jgi:hypothetical protein
MAFSMFMYRVPRGTYLGVCPLSSSKLPEPPTQSIYIYIYLSCLSSCHPVTPPSILHPFRLSFPTAQQYLDHCLSLLSLLAPSSRQQQISRSKQQHLLNTSLDIHAIRH